MHDDNAVEITGRSKNMMIPVGEHIPAIEVKDVRYRNLAVMDCAVVTRPNKTSGKTPRASVNLCFPPGNVTEAGLIHFCHESIDRSKAPMTVVRCELPNTFTAKIQQFQRCNQAQELCSVP